MARYGPKDVAVTLDDGGGTPRTISALILDGIEIPLDSEVQDTTGLGQSGREQTPVGLSVQDNIDLRVIFDDALNSSYDSFKAPDTDPNGTSRTLSVTVGAKTFTGEVWLKSSKVVVQTSELVVMDLTLAAKTPGTWA